MKTDKRHMAVRLLLQALGMTYTFYVLGAGASAGVIPLTRDLKRTIVARYRSFGMYPVERIQPDPVFQRVIGDPTEDTDALTAALLEYLFPSAVHAMVLRQLAPSPGSYSAHQYSLFLLAAKPSTLFNLNVDGLARQYCLGHYLLEPHGRIPPGLVHNPNWDQLIDALLEFGFDAPQIPGVLLPQPEPITITSRPAYLAARELFPASRFLVIIGYSFGKSPDNSSFDDVETFEFLRECLRTNGKTVLVLSPEPEFVGFLCRESMRSHTDTVHEFSAYWNHLSRAIAFVQRTSGFHNFRCLAEMTAEILYKYDELCDTEV